MPTARPGDERSNVRPIRRRSSGMDWSRVEAWRHHPHLTPRQAAALVAALNTIADVHLAPWLQDPRDPLHEVVPFDELDRRALIHLNENRAWVTEAQDRCWAVAENVLRGELPHDGTTCYFDELVVYAACHLAADSYADHVAEGFFDTIPEAGHDDDWLAVSSWLTDEMRSNAHYLFASTTPGDPHVATELAAHHPFTWFDFA